MIVRLRDIANLANVSEAAASYALNGKGSLRAETRSRVLECAAKLGYRINASARAMRTGLFQAIGFLMGMHAERSRISQSLLEGIQAACEERLLHLHLARLSDTKLTTKDSLPTILAQWAVDGLLLNYTKHLPHAVTSQIRKHSIPVVRRNVKQNVDCVHPDDYGAAEMATNKLISLGHRQIAYLDYFVATQHDFPEHHYSNEDRHAGYVAAMEKAGLPIRTSFGMGPIAMNERVAASRQLLGQSDRPTAILANGEFTSTSVLCAAIANGLTLGVDLSFVTFAESPICDFDAKISSLVVPEREMGSAAVEMLCRKIDTPSAPIPAQVIRYGEIVGETCSSPQSGTS